MKHGPSNEAPLSSAPACPFSPGHVKISELPAVKLQLLYLTAAFPVIIAFESSFPKERLCKRRVWQTRWSTTASPKKSPHPDKKQASTQILVLNKDRES